MNLAIALSLVMQRLAQDVTSVAWSACAAFRDRTTICIWWTADVLTLSGYIVHRVIAKSVRPSCFTGTTMSNTTHIHSHIFIFHAYTVRAWYPLRRRT
eukprot:SAG31_NODE_37503_length_303_cov_2.470588_1_plen_97_part_10